jgi:threonine dehydrogenase-like Zn-dependent dehydrogenase
VKALVFTSPGTVELREVPEPQVADGEALVHVRSAGICGSELHGVRHPGFRVPPLIMGHEFTGVSDSGDPVVINPLLSCGDCDMCARGEPQLCRRRALIGVHRSGGFAERVAVPVSAVRTLPAGLSLETAALTEPAANAVHAWRVAGGSAGMRVAVLGCGAIGLFCMLTALAAGAASVDMADLSDARREHALRLGATAASTALVGEYDIVVDAVGAAATHAQSVQHQRPGGTAVWLGLADQTAGFDASALVREQKQILGSFAYDDADFGLAAEMLADWDVSWAAPYPLSAGAEIFTELMNGASHPVKALLQP